MLHAARAVAQGGSASVLARPCPSGCVRRGRGFCGRASCGRQDLEGKAPDGRSWASTAEPYPEPPCRALARIVIDATPSRRFTLAWEVVNCSSLYVVAVWILSRIRLAVEFAITSCSSQMCLSVARGVAQHYHSHALAEKKSELCRLRFDLARGLKCSVPFWLT